MSLSHNTAREHAVSLPDGAVLRVLDDGAGPALLLISGLGGTANFWNPCIPAFATHYRTLRLDQRGIAKSSRGSAPCTIDQLALDCLAVLDACDIKTAMIVGHSTGGCIAQTMALLAPDRIQACVFSATWGKPSRHRKELFSTRREMLFRDPVGYACSSVFMGHDAHWLNNNWSVLENARANAPVTPEAQRIVAERLDALIAFDRSADVHQISIPKLILGARDDLIVPSFLQEELATLLKDADLHLFEQGGHFFPVTRTQLFIPLVLEWLRTSSSRISHA
jgi:pimeloyl-ACP methyl ester carboxylesterase